LKGVATKRMSGALWPLSLALYSPASGAFASGDSLGAVALLFKVVPIAWCFLTLVVFLLLYEEPFAKRLAWTALFFCSPLLPVVLFLVFVAYGS